MSYGKCPVCLEQVIRRERRLNGNDTCSQGHVFPSRDTIIGEPEPEKETFKQLYDTIAGVGINYTISTVAKQLMADIKNGKYKHLRYIP